MPIITFTDVDGVEQTLDTEKKFNVAYHVDCRVLMSALPDKCFDLCCADPPYGDGLSRDESSQIGNVERERERERDRADVEPLRRVVRPLQGNDSSDSTAEERKIRGRSTSRQKQHYVNRGGTLNTLRETVARTGGTWAEKYGKKS